MQFAHALDDGLAGLRIAAHPEGRILFRESAQSHAHFFLVGLGLGFDADADDRFRKDDLLEHDGARGVAQSVPGGGVLEAHDGRDLAGVDLFHLFPLIRVHAHYASDALLFALGRVQYVGTAPEHPGVVAEISERSHVRVGGHLEGQGGERFLVLGFAEDLLRGRSGTLDRRQVQRRRQIIHDRIQHQLHAFVLQGRAAKNRHDLVLDGRFAQDPLQVLQIYLGALQVSVHHLVVVVHDLLHQVVAHLLHSGLEILGDVDRDDALSVLALETVCFALQKIYDALEVALGPDVQLNGDRASGQTFMDGSQGFLEARAHPVELVDEADARHVVFVRIVPVGLGLGLHAGHSVENHHRAVQNAQRTLHLHGEVDVSRSIDEIDAMFVSLVALAVGRYPKSGGRGGSDGDAPLPLLLHPIHDRGAFVHLPDLMGNAGIEKNALGDRGLARVDMRDDAYVPDLFDRILPGHVLISLLDPPWPVSWRNERRPGSLPPFYAYPASS